MPAARQIAWGKPVARLSMHDLAAAPVNIEIADRRFAASPATTAQRSSNTRATTYPDPKQPSAAAASAGQQASFSGLHFGHQHISAAHYYCC